jgi:NAD+ kinase
MTSTSGSSRLSQPVEAAAVVSHGRLDVHEAEERVRAVARDVGVRLVDDPAEAQLAVALGGDGTILRTLARLLGTDVPVIGVNFGRVGFLASIAPDDLERGLTRAFVGDYATVELPTLEAHVDGEAFVAVNDVVATSSTLGRMIELAWAVDGESLDTVPCDGMICSTPSGSTAYNLSNGGPVLARGLDAMAVTFIAPHSLHARPLVLPRGAELALRNVTPDVGAAVLVDGHRVDDIPPEGRLTIGLGDQRSLLATLPETTFFGRYRQTFTSHP